MSIGNAVVEKYQRLYADLCFEREGLFQCVQEKYQPREVLYPGCSIHVTPAFYFPHVVFVDQAPAALEFFSNQDMVLDLIRRRCRYQRSPYIQFIAQDFTRPLPVAEGQFDLILALYAGGVAKSCTAYLKTGGLLLTNNFQNDAVEASQDQEFVLAAIVEVRQGSYRCADQKPGEPLKIGRPGAKSKRNLRQTSHGLEYVDNDVYYVFRKLRPRK